MHPDRHHLAVRQVHRTADSSCMQKKSVSSGQTGFLWRTAGYSAGFHSRTATEKPYSAYKNGKEGVKWGAGSQKDKAGSVFW